MGLLLDGMGGVWDANENGDGMEWSAWDGNGMQLDYSWNGHGNLDDVGMGGVDGMMGWDRMRMEIGWDWDGMEMGLGMEMG